MTLRVFKAPHTSERCVAPSKFDKTLILIYLQCHDIYYRLNFGMPCVVWCNQFFLEHKIRRRFRFGLIASAAFVLQTRLLQYYQQTVVVNTATRSSKDIKYQTQVISDLHSYLYLSADALRETSFVTLSKRNATLLPVTQAHLSLSTQAKLEATGSQGIIKTSPHSLMSVPVCRFYNLNQTCRFGKHCRYLHPVTQRPPPSSTLRDENEEHLKNPEDSFATLTISDKHERLSVQENEGSLSSESVKQPSQNQGLAHSTKDEDAVPFIKETEC